MMLAEKLRNDAVDLDADIAEAHTRYAARRPKSREAAEAAAQAMPGGNTRTVLYHGPFPLRVERGEGARFQDVDGYAYLNLLGEFTAGIFGHSHPVIRAAITEVLERGISFGAHNMHEIELARLVCERFPSVELVRFTNSGTEANLMAVSTARAVTGRGKVMVFRGGYHGGLLYFAGRGSPINAPFPFVFARYNDLEGARAVIREHGADLACILVEPMMGSSGCIPGDPDFMGMLRAESLASGALLIFDEVMTSRLSPGGAQAILGIRPDLTTFGKYLGGGLSFGAFGGARALMERYDPRRPGFIPHAGTFNNNVLSMAAGAAGLSQVLTPAALDALNRRGDRLRDELNTLFQAEGAPFQATGLGSLMNIHPCSGAIRSPEDLSGADDRRRELLFLDLLEEGFYIARRGFIALSVVLTDAELAAFLAVVHKVVRSRPALRN